jgi:peptidyl-prolyl cis-trans isomerase SurA
VRPMPKRLPSLFLLLALALLPAPPLRAEVLNRVVLRINDKIATLYDYQQRREELVRDILRHEQDPEERRRLLSQAPEVAYSDLFRELLLESRADQLGVEVTDAQVDGAVAQLKQNYNIKNDQDLQTALAQNGMTLAQLKVQLRGQLRVQEVRSREVQSRIKVDEEDLRRYYRKNLETFRQPEQVQLREVVVLEEGGTGGASERQQQAEQIREKVKNGASLADAVAETSKNGVTSSVIDLGWVSPGDLDKNLETAVWKLPKGDLSPPVPARGGLHLVQVVDRRESRIPAFSEVSAAIQAKEQERVFRQEITKYMAELEKKSLVAATPPAEAANFRRVLNAETSGGPEGIGSPAAAAAATAPAAAQTPPEVVPAPVPGRSDAGAPSTLPTPKPVDSTPAPAVPPPG